MKFKKKNTYLLITTNSIEPTILGFMNSFSRSEQIVGTTNSLKEAMEFKNKSKYNSFKVKT